MLEELRLCRLKRRVKYEYITRHPRQSHGASTIENVGGGVDENSYLFATRHKHVQRRKKARQPLTYITRPLARKSRRSGEGTDDITSKSMMSISDSGEV